MKVTKDLEELLRRIRLDHEEIVERFRFLDWSAEDAERLGAAAQHMAPAQQAFVDHLYRHLTNFSTPSALLRAPEVTARLKHSQVEYYQCLWGGPFDDTYVNGRLRIGVIHQQVGLELKWYLGSYRLYLDDMLKSVFGDSQNATLYSSLLKAVFFDMTLAIDTYSAAQHKALEDSEARFARALRGANDGIWDWHVDQDRLYVSERWASMLDLNRDSIGESSASWFGRVHPDDLPDFRQAIDAHIKGQTSSVHHEYRIRQKNGGYIWVLVRGVAEVTTTGQLRMAGSQSDISARKDAEQRLNHAAHHDPLTGLANRMRLDEQMQKTFMKRRKGGAHEALLFIDLDRFKLINDSLGHNVGDRVLVEVAQRLRDALRPSDQLFRFGGDEFIVLLHELSCERDAEQISQRILDNLHQPLHLDGRVLVVSASIGIAPLHDHGKALDVLQAADLALYRAKSAGKARFAHYSEALQDTAQHHLELESALGQALQHNEFELHYQPIYRLEQGTPLMSGVEALVRWRHGERLISPLEFIPALEESGEIIRVGEWVLRQACQQTRLWQLAGHGHLRCSVNISSLQLQQADFILRVIDILRESGLPPASLILEITESQLMHDDLDTLACLNELASLGVLLALDDFGTGYSSLGYLTRFPLHILKLDKSFIGGIPYDNKQSSISQAIIGLGRSLGLEVVAEGIESPAQLDFVVGEGCHYAQGYWFSRPRPAAQMQRLFSGEDCFEGLGCPLL
ncbi:PAS domain S-box-containing protein/diguanylate cyclase (GGDEF) domain-containing protein [Pseudomonas mohnii]|jgi:diguanylate cyclase (GGDEF)-like protein/PAS domain S-box-containing protein|uniref:Diguanylate cyclase DosC n=1 Tax=Pseudomonas mohnii TaxID=395600 RepID=A0ABY0YB48_9PSED|nr:MULTISPECIES: EAL domain-containing protein [Pseudomonas]SED26304.1 PAS domain S-box-containing protein/diguanylate cyclase (GGDEF) domain-containing protein [Pseudomonas mohnii]